MLGDPQDFAMQYYNDGADEIIYLDIVASLYGRSNLLEIVKKTAQNIFIPLTVGGGVRNLDDVSHLLKAGADKIAINTAAVKNPSLISPTLSEETFTFGQSQVESFTVAIRKGAKAV